jgi:hypothetical protein
VVADARAGHFVLCFSQYNMHRACVYHGTDDVPSLLLLTLADEGGFRSLMTDPVCSTVLDALLPAVTTPTSMSTTSVDAAPGQDLPLKGSTIALVIPKKTCEVRVFIHHVTPVALDFKEAQISRPPLFTLHKRRPMWSAFFLTVLPQWRKVWDDLGVRCDDAVTFATPPHDAAATAAANANDDDKAAATTASSVCAADDVDAFAFAAAVRGALATTATLGGAVGGGIDWRLLADADADAVAVAYVDAAPGGVVVAGEQRPRVGNVVDAAFRTPACMNGDVRAFLRAHAATSAR